MAYAEDLNQRLYDLGVELLRAQNLISSKLIAFRSEIDDIRKVLEKQNEVGEVRMENVESNKKYPSY